MFLNVNLNIIYSFKSQRDQHFSVLSYYLKKLESKKRITNINEILDCLNTSQNESNDIRYNNGVQPINSIALIIPPEKIIKTGFFKDYSIGISL